MQGNLGGPAAAVACVFASLPVRFEGIAIISLQTRQKESLGQWRNFGSSGISLRLLPRETCRAADGRNLGRKIRLPWMDLLGEKNKKYSWKTRNTAENAQRC